MARDRLVLDQIYAMSSSGLQRRRGAAASTHNDDDDEKKSSYANGGAETDRSTPPTSHAGKSIRLASTLLIIN